MLKAFITRYEDRNFGFYIPEKRKLTFVDIAKARKKMKSAKRCITVENNDIIWNKLCKQYGRYEKKRKKSYLVSPPEHTFLHKLRAFQKCGSETSADTLDYVRTEDSDEVMAFLESQAEVQQLNLDICFKSYFQLKFQLKIHSRSGDVLPIIRKYNLERLELFKFEDKDKRLNFKMFIKCYLYDLQSAISELQKMFTIPITIFINLLQKLHENIKVFALSLVIAPIKDIKCSYEYYGNKDPEYVLFKNLMMECLGLTRFYQDDWVRGFTIDFFLQMLMNATLDSDVKMKIMRNFDEYYCQMVDEETQRFTIFMLRTVLEQQYNFEASGMCDREQIAIMLNNMIRRILVNYGLY
jgi:hypothetical protein